MLAVFPLHPEAVPLRLNRQISIRMDLGMVNHALHCVIIEFSYVYHVICTILKNRSSCIISNQTEKATENCLRGGFWTEGCRMDIKQGVCGWRNLLRLKSFRVYYQRVCGCYAGGLLRRGRGAASNRLTLEAPRG